MGKLKIISGDMKSGAVVIDVGINRGIDGKLCGDVDIQTCRDMAFLITPVPAEVRPMTISMSLANTIKVAEPTAS